MRTRSGLREFVGKFLTDYYEYSDGYIVQMLLDNHNISVSRVFVGNIRKELEKAGDIPKINKWLTLSEGKRRTDKIETEPDNITQFKNFLDKQNISKEELELMLIIIQRELKQIEIFHDLKDSGF